MRPLDEYGLDASQRRIVGAALREDPALEEELMLISGLLRPALRPVFWRAFADTCGGGERPAAAVLGALERAAASGCGGVLHP